MSRIAKVDLFSSRKGLFKAANTGGYTKWLVIFLVRNAAEFTKVDRYHNFTIMGDYPYYVMFDGRP